eukprot:TRINITY_DN1363_c0_g2_i1.p1 TRINITY_DN1363_c0_g2~~TRINITY_DN1363_c0_g2_i1.p1  ORF type:complete len:265 (+),score=57.16 TRINITY_DN1363_c0_g2_i1:59-796(+)
MGDPGPAAALQDMLGDLLVDIDDEPPGLDDDPASPGPDFTASPPRQEVGGRIGRTYSGGGPLGTTKSFEGEAQVTRPKLPRAVTAPADTSIGQVDAELASFQSMGLLPGAQTMLLPGLLPSAMSMGSQGGRVLTSDEVERQIRGDDKEIGALAWAAAGMAPPAPAPLPVAPEEVDEDDEQAGGGGRRRRRRRRRPRKDPRSNPEYWQNRPRAEECCIVPVGMEQPAPPEPTPLPVSYSVLHSALN